MTLLLASRSATRRQMLAAAAVPFSACDTDLDEEAAKTAFRRHGLNARSLALALAESKALAVAAAPNDLVLGADQTLERADGSMLDKAGSREEALEQLRTLSGTTHKLHAAAAIARAGRIRWRRVATVKMHVRPLSEAFLQSYLGAEYDAVRFNLGCYRVEGMGIQLFHRIDGDHFAIMGLPLIPLLVFLRRQGMLEP
jgi:septum formation protein